MKKLFLALLLITFWPSPSHAQGYPNNFEVLCPSGSVPVSGPTGTSFNQSTGKYRATTCIDPFGNITGINLATTSSNINGEIWFDNVRYQTIQAAMNAANASPSSNGIVRVGCGTFTGPTTFYSSVAIVSLCPFLYNMVGALTANSVPPVTGTFFTYTTNLSLSSISNSKIDGITFDFQNNGAGIVIGNAYTNNEWPNVAVVRCGSPTVDCIAWQTSGSAASGNSAFNDFGNLYILTNQTTNNQANCMTMNGSGPVNAGAFPTDNFFNNVVCTGGTRNGLVFRLNTDTNYFKRAFIVTLSQVANTGCIVLNDATPASDQDTDGGTIENLVCTGFPVFFRAGQTSGWVFKVAGGGGTFPSFVNLGGTPLFRVDWIGLGPGSNSDIIVGGRVSASGIAGSGAGTGSIAGDITAARTSSSGAIFIGNDGSQLFRSGQSASLSAGATQWNFPGSIGLTSNLSATPNILCSFSTPTISSGFGTSPSIVGANGPCSFTINVGTGGTATSGVIGLTVNGSTTPNGWNIFCNDITTFSTTVFITRQTASSTSTATIGNFNSSATAAAWAAGDILTCTATAR